MIWKLIIFAIVGAVRAIDVFTDSDKSHRTSDPAERTQDVTGYTRSDGTRVRSYRRRPGH